VRNTIERAIDGFADGSGEVEFMSAFASPVPLEIISDRLGIPHEDRALFYDAATAAADENVRRRGAAARIAGAGAAAARLRSQGVQIGKADLFSTGL